MDVRTVTEGANPDCDQAVSQGSGPEGSPEGAEFGQRGLVVGSASLSELEKTTLAPRGKICFMSHVAISASMPRAPATPESPTAGSGKEVSARSSRA